MRLVFALAALLAAGAALAQADPLPAWNDGVAKARIVGFVRAVTEQGGRDYVPPADRIAVFGSRSRRRSKGT